MADAIDTVVIKKTQEIVGSVIKKPALTEKSLRKPPFRFLHDIVTNIIKSTGFLKGLYTPEELQSENVKDKERKIAFLQKAIDVLSIVTHQPVNLKPSKVVAGHDPQKTNLFLQSLATAAKNKVESREAVEKVLREKSPTKAPKDRRASVDKQSKDKEKAHARSLTKTLDPVKKNQSKEAKSREGEKSKEKKTKKSTKEENPVPQNVDVEKKEEKEEEEEKRGNEQTLDTEMTTNEESLDQDQDNPEMPFPSSEEKPARERSHQVHSSRSARPPSARNKRTKPVEENDTPVRVPREPVVAAFVGNKPLVPEEQTFENILVPTIRPPSARPSSSRPAPPRIRIRHVVDNEENSFRPATAKPVENLILDQQHPSEEEEEEEEDGPEEMDGPSEIEVSRPTLPDKTPEDDKGSLVKKLLETKKDLEGGSQHTPTKKVEIVRRQHDSASRELGQLRHLVQSLSKTAVPLGRMLDFLQEDLDAMRAELRMWREEHAQNWVALHKEQSATESLLEPLGSQLDDLEQVVSNQLEANSALKSSIARNDERIQRMVASLNQHQLF